MTDFFFVLVLIAMVLTVLALGTGIVLMAKGGELNQKYGNKLMQARVWMQGIAIGLLVLAFLSS